MKRTSMAISAAALTFLASAIPAAAAPRRGGPPETTFQVRFGAFFPSADSDFWAENEAVFTLDSSDFDDFVLGFSIIRSLNPQAEIGINVDFYEETELSRYRDPIPGFPDIIPYDEFGNAIQHDTELSLVPLSVDLRFVPGGKYRVSPRSGFIPRTAFYVGGGIGVTFWEYEEFGDFIDFFAPEGPQIISASFGDEGAAFEVHALAGVDMPLSRAASLVFEGRYSWAEDDLGGDFEGLGELDLGGSSFFGGFSFRF